MFFQLVGRVFWAFRNWTNPTLLTMSTKKIVRFVNISYVILVTKKKSYVILYIEKKYIYIYIILIIYHLVVTSSCPKRTYFASQVLKRYTRK